MQRGELVILGTRTMLDYAERVAYHIETFPEFRETVSLRRLVQGLHVVKFADGEMEIEVKTSLRGKDVFLFANAARNSQGISVEENKMELYHAIDALRRARAERIVLFEPFCSCSRSDRITRKNSVGFWVHYKTLISLGVNHIVTYQLHSDKSKTVVDPTICAIDDLPVHQLLEEYLTDTYIRHDKNWSEEVRPNWIFCSVDSGGENLAKKFANDFGCSLMVAHKTRDYSKQNSIGSIKLLTDVEIKDRTAWIIDDMLDTGGSVYALAQELQKQGVREINIVVTHPVLSPPCTERLKTLREEGILKDVVVVDTIDCESLIPDLPFVSTISSARRSAEIVLRMHAQESLSLFFEKFSLSDYLSKQTLFSV